MKKLSPSILIWSLLVLFYLSYKLAQREWGEVPLLHGWLPDILCLPIVLGFVQITMKRFRPQFSLSGLMVAVAIIYVSVLFEVILPKLSSQYTADMWDVLCYASGGFAFWLYQHRAKARWWSALKMNSKTHQGL